MKMIQIMTLGLDKMEKMSNSKVVKALEAALAYPEQQGETTATDVMLLRRWCDLITRKRTKSGKQTSLTHFLNDNFCILPYVY
jgi:hypothetical protein